MTQSLKSVNAITLFVDDMQRSKEFYERVFDVAVIDEEEEGTVILKFDNVFMRLLVRGEAEKEMLGKVPLADVDSGASFEMAVFVEDAEAACAELVEHGVSIAFGPVDRPWGVRHVAFRDPDGHLWVLSSDIPTS
jgi:catechol 2,3-dioxygenase-like lactoylglutathione lyase family enzyme